MKRPINNLKQNERFSHNSNTYRIVSQERGMTEVLNEQTNVLQAWPHNTGRGLLFVTKLL